MFQTFLNANNVVGLQAELKKKKRITLPEILEDLGRKKMRQVLALDILKMKKQNRPVQFQTWNKRWVC